MCCNFFCRYFVADKNRNNCYCPLEETELAYSGQVEVAASFNNTKVSAAKVEVQRTFLEKSES